MSNDRRVPGPGGTAGTLRALSGEPTPHADSTLARGGVSGALRRRADQLQDEERRLLCDWERSRRRFTIADRRLQNQTSAWEARILKAMRWPQPRAWWRTNRRVEAGERWIGHDAEARWLQRVVYVTRDRVLELAARREAALAPLRAARIEAGRELRETTRRLVATAGRRRALFVLGVQSFVLRDLLGGKPEPITTEPGGHGAAGGRR